MDLRRGGRGRRSCAAPHHLSSAARGLALVLLGLRGHRAGGGPGLVSGGGGPPRATSLDDSAGGRVHSIRIAAPPGGSLHEGPPLGDDSGEQRGVVDLAELFRLLLCRQHFLYLVLHLSQHGARPGSQVELLFRDASVFGDGRLLTRGWLDQRPPDEALWETHGPLWDCGGVHRAVGAVHRAGDAGGGRPAGKHRAGGRRRRLVSFPEFLLVGDGRHRRPFGRNRFRRNEYDRAIWRRRGPFSHSIAGCAIWLVGGVPGGRRPGCRGLSRLAVCESRADTAWEVRGKDLTI